MFETAAGYVWRLKDSLFGEHSAENTEYQWPVRDESMLSLRWSGHKIRSGWEVAAVRFPDVFYVQVQQPSREQWAVSDAPGDVRHGSRPRRGSP